MRKKLEKEGGREGISENGFGIARQLEKKKTTSWYENEAKRRLNKAEKGLGDAVKMLMKDGCMLKKD